MTVRARRSPGRGPREKQLSGVERIRLDQNTVQIQAAQRHLERKPLTGIVSVTGLLGQGDAKGSGVICDLGVKSMVAVVRLDG